MKRLAIIALLLSSVVFAHQTLPETKFFQAELAKNPMIENVLTWCSLIGLDNEAACREEMYKDDLLSDAKIQAASNCVEKNGMKYRVAFDNFSKDSLKDSSLVSHQ